MKRRVLLVPVFLLLVLVLVLGACTKATPTTTQPAVTTTTAAPTTTAKPAPTTSAPAATTTTTKPTTAPVTTSTVAPTSQAVNKYGGTLKFAWNQFSPLMGYPPTSTDPGNFFGGYCIEGLIQASGTPYVYVPGLATSWELAPDKSYFTFKLRQGVKFHDGTDFNALAAAWTISNAIATKRATIAQLKGVVVIDDYTLRVDLNQWDAFALGLFSGGLNGMTSPTYFQAKGQTATELNPVGTGPFKFAGFEQNLYTKYVKNPNYWDPKIPYLDGIQIDMIKDPMTMQAALLKGDYDGARSVDPLTAQTLLKTGKFVSELGGLGCFQFYYNSMDPNSIWSKQQMREALEYSLDKQTLAEVFGLGFRTPNYDIIGGIWEVPGNNPGSALRKYDLAKATQLVKDAGYPNGVTVPLELSTAFNSDAVTAAMAMAAKAGIRIVYEEGAPYPSNVNLAKSQQLTPPNTLRWTRARGSDNNPLQAAYEDLISTQTLKYIGTKRPPGYDAGIAQALQTTDAPTILTILNDLERKAYAEVMFVPVYVEYDINVWSPKLKNDRGTPAYFMGTTGGSQMKYTYYVK